MDYNGDVLMCPHDWGKKIILGNMNKDNFLDIWTSKKAIAIRKKLNKSEEMKSIPNTIIEKTVKMLFS